MPHANFKLCLAGSLTRILMMISRNLSLPHCAGQNAMLPAIMKERIAFENAIRRVEAEMARRAPDSEWPA